MARSVTVLFVVIKLLRRDQGAGWNLFVPNAATQVHSYQLYLMNTVDSDIHYTIHSINHSINFRFFIPKMKIDTTVIQICFVRLIFVLKIVRICS